METTTKPKSVFLGTALPEDVYEQFKMVAQKSGRSVRGMARYILRRELSQIIADQEKGAATSTAAQ